MIIILDIKQYTRLEKQNTHILQLEECSKVRMLKRDV